jgi:hypothetical protein
MKLSELHRRCNELAHRFGESWSTELQGVPHVLVLQENGEVGTIPIPLTINEETCYLMGRMTCDTYPEAAALFLINEDWLQLEDYLKMGETARKLCLVLEGQNLEHRGCYSLYGLQEPDKGLLVQCYYNEAKPRTPMGTCVRALVEGYQAGPLG